jgi:hypothetical protein
MVVASFLLGSCSPPNDQPVSDGPTVFASAEEAAAKGKTDLLSILGSQKDLNLGVDSKELEAAEQGTLIRYSEVNFQRLLATDSLDSLDGIATERSMIAPFIQNGRVVAVIEVARSGDGWKAAALGNKPIADGLNAAGLSAKGPNAITIYEVPNLQVMVYGVRSGGTEYYHVDHDPFSVKDTTSIGLLFPVLRDQARQFQQQFGDQLSKDQLVK